jgi:hypothetical protein
VRRPRPAGCATSRRARCDLIASQRCPGRPLRGHRCVGGVLAGCGRPRHAERAVGAQNRRRGRADPRRPPPRFDRRPGAEKINRPRTPPFNGCTPRSSKCRPEPATRSFAVSHVSCRDAIFGEPHPVTTSATVVARVQGTSLGATSGSRCRARARACWFLQFRG